VTATGGSGTITYQWYSSNTEDNTAGTPIPNATNRTYTPAAADINISIYKSHYYYVVVEDDNEMVRSRVAAIDIAELIDTPAKLAAIDASTSNGAIYKLTKDIDLTDTYGSGTGWTPIGSLAVPFKGTFKGGNKTISGLYINLPSDSYVGLFGYLGEGAEVSDVIISLSTSGIVGYVTVGGLAGYAKGTTAKPIEIKNIHITDNNKDGIKTASNGGNAAAGGIVGELAGNVTIRGSSNSVAVSVTTNWDANSGGIAGKATSSDYIYNSFNTGSISAYSYNSGSSYAGGIVGYGGRAIERCYNNGVVGIASSRRVSYAGGIIGYTIAETSIYDSYNTGGFSVETVSNAAYAGGIAGYQTSGSTISNTYNTKDVSAKSGNGNAYVGGITGAFSSATGNRLANSVAANTSLTATPGGSGTTYINRVVASPAISSSNTTSLGNNLALSTMTATANESDYSFVETDTVNYGESKTAALLRQKATYSTSVSEGGLGWKFGEDNDNVWNDSNPWKINTNISQYPTLYWQK
jgi:hypothetical protein